MPESAEDKSVTRVCQISNQLKQLEQELKISNRCSDTERKQLLDSLFEYEPAFGLNDEELGKTDVVEHCIDTAGANPVREVPSQVLQL